MNGDGDRSLRMAWTCALVFHFALFLIVFPESTNGLSDALSVLVESREKREKMGHRGRHRAEKVFSQGQTLRKYLALYESLAREGEALS